MLNAKVYDVCAHYCEVCHVCPLLKTCKLPHEKMDGETLEEKTAWWETMMNDKAKEVKL